MNLDIDIQQLTAEIRKVMPSKIAADLCSVQPMNGIDFTALRNDELFNKMLGNFIERNTK